MKSFLFALVITSLCSLSWAQAEFQYQRQVVKDNIFMLSGSGGNIGVIAGEDGLLVIDNGFSRNADALNRALADFGQTPKLALNTHWHGDHLGANAALSEQATIIAHENVYQRLFNPELNPEHRRPKKPTPPQAIPTIRFQQSLSLNMNGQDISVEHFPNGHTDGDSIIFIKTANVIHMGDHFFANAFPFVDLESQGSVQGYIDNVSAVITRSDGETMIIPGHGPLSNVTDLIKFRNMLLETSAIVGAYQQQGLSLEDAQQKGLPTQWQSWGKGFINTDRWIKTLYQGL